MNGGILKVERIEHESEIELIMVEIYKGDES
jgi:hypothetical protein